MTNPKAYQMFSQERYERSGWKEVHEVATSRANEQRQSEANCEVI